MTQPKKRLLAAAAFVVTLAAGCSSQAKGPNPLTIATDKAVVKANAAVVAYDQHQLLIVGTASCLREPCPAQMLEAQLKHDQHKLQIAQERLKAAKSN